MGGDGGRPDEADNQPLIGALLRILHQSLAVRIMEPGLEAAGYGDIHPAHFPVMQALTQWSRGLRSTELAARAQITKQSMGNLVDHLEARGYVERVPDPSDGRAKVVRLTPRGWDAIRIMRGTVRQAEAEWSDVIGPERVEQLRSALRDLVASLGR